MPQDAAADNLNEFVMEFYLFKDILTSSIFNFYCKFPKHFA